MSSPFSRILVANRGEIAARIIRSVHALGYESVAVYSDADADAPFVAMAGRAVPLGDPKVARSYLDIDKIVNAALASGADAIHPGYGFLSENAVLAESCRDAGLVFIGPEPHSIRTMGDKRQAKERMLKAGVPCIPGHLGDAQHTAAFEAAAQKIGLPVIIKAAAGGGGRGMRQVRDLADLGQNLQAAQSEAQNAFGDGTVYLEKLVEGGRHIEIQIVADKHGHVVHLGERECSVQRRFQKVVEEAPSPFLDEELRERMGSAAIAAARAVDYVGVGTVEFLVDAERDFYFIEMNTRLQVEHPVTEMVTGIDLVELQLHVAAGGELPFDQSAVRIEGHAIEARLYAEDPDNGYLPQTGRILHWRPKPSEGVRIDSGVREGMDLTPHYDAMVAKVIAFAGTRDGARRRLMTALRRTPLLGVASNRSLLLGICSNEEFAAGKATTDFLQKSAFERAKPPCDFQLAVAALLHGWPEGQSLDRWARSGSAEWLLKIDETTVTIRKDRAGQISATAGSRTYEIRPLSIDDAKIRCLIDGVAYDFIFARTPDVIEIDFEGDRLAVERHRKRTRSTDSQGGEGVLVAPINGLIIRLNIEQGQVVTRGQPLMVIEAMKMEMVLSAPADGVINLLDIREGQQVSARQQLLAVTPNSQELQ